MRAIRTKLAVERLGARTGFRFLSAALGVATGALLARAPSTALPDWVGSAWVGTSEEARSALANIGGAQLTVLGVALSVTILLFQSLSAQYSPRLVPPLVRRTGLRAVLSVFAFSLGYDVAAAHGVSASPLSGPSPRPVVAVAYALLVVGLGVLLFELATIPRRIQPGDIVTLVARETADATRRLDLAWAHWSVTRRPADPLPPDSAPIRSPAGGYVRAIDGERLLEWTRGRSLRVRIDRAVGDYVSAHDVVGWVVGGAGAIDAAQRRRLAEEVLVLGHSRDVRSDVLFGFRLLADIADRALSPAMNDPYTAIQALEAARSPLHLLSEAPRGVLAYERDGAPAARVTAPSLGEYVSAVVDGPLRYGAADPDVLAEIADLAGSLGRKGSPEAVEVARALLGTVANTACASLDAVRAAIVREHAAAVERSVADRAAEVPRWRIGGSTRPRAKPS